MAGGYLTLPRALGHALPAGAEAPRGRHVARLPGDRRRPRPTRPCGDAALRVLQLAAVHDAAAAGRRRRAAPSRCGACRGPRRRRRRRRASTTPRSSRPTRPTAPGAHGRGRPDAPAGQGRELRRRWRYTAPVARLRRAASGAWRRAACSRSRPTTCCWRTSTRAWSGATRRATCAEALAAALALGLTTAEAAEVLRPATTRPTSSASEAGLVAAAAERRGGARGGGQRRPVARAALRRGSGEPALGRGPSPRSAASSRRSPRGRRPRPACPRSRGRSSRAGRVVAAGLELDGDVDDPAGVGHEVRRPQDPAAAQQVGDAVVGELVVGRAGDRRRSAGAGRSRGRARRPARTGASTSTSARSAPSAGVTQRAPRSRAPARAWPGRCRRPAACAPRGRSTRGHARPTCPSPSTATVRPAQRRRCRRPARTSRAIAASTPEGGVRARVARAAAPARAGPVTCGVRSRDHASCRAPSVPTSSAVM